MVGVSLRSKCAFGLRDERGSSVEARGKCGNGRNSEKTRCTTSTTSSTGPLKHRSQANEFHAKILPQARRCVLLHAAPQRMSRVQPMQRNAHLRCGVARRLQSVRAFCSRLQRESTHDSMNSRGLNAKTRESRSHWRVRSTFHARPRTFVTSLPQFCMTRARAS